jgi:bifunctional DNA-binding transcriptional regulator/antitoxin component of YhaV-PrlF toxin-antitoxin module
MMKRAHVTMAANGRLVIPARMRAALKMERGGALLARLEGARSSSSRSTR